MNRQIIVAVGPVCVGKTTYSQRYPLNWIKIDVGDIVRELTQTETRIHNKDLDGAIINRLSTELKDLNHNFVIVGVRQKSIAQAIEKLSNFDELTFVILDAPQSVLEKRYQERAAAKDLQLTFQQAIARDVALGYNDMIRWIRESSKWTQIKTYEDDTVQKGQEWKNAGVDH